MLMVYVVTIVVAAVAWMAVKDGIRLKLLIGVDGHGYELSLCSVILFIKM